GLPIDANGDRVGHPFVWLSIPAVLGGLGIVGFALVHGSTFLALKTDGPVRERAARFSATWAPLLLLPCAAWALWVQFTRGGGNRPWWGRSAVAGGGMLFGWISARERSERFAFPGYSAFIVFGAGAIFAGMFPYELPSTLDPSHGLT